MIGFAQIRWLRLILAAFLVELVLFALVVPLRFLPNGFRIELAAVLPACVAAAFLGGWWVAARARLAPVLHGTLVGVAAALMYAALTWKYTLPGIFVAANYAKVLGGAAGGAAARHRLKRTAGATPEGTAAG